MKEMFEISRKFFFAMLRKKNKTRIEGALDKVSDQNVENVINKLSINPMQVFRRSKFIVKL